MSTSADHDAAIQELCQALAQRSASVFLGAGMNVGLARPDGVAFPLGDGLARQLAATLPQDDLTGRALTHVAELVEFQMKARAGLNSLVREALTGFRPGAGHAALANLPFDSIWTTNYDLLLEEAFRTSLNPAGVLRPVFTSRMDVNLKDDAIPYYKLHGSIDQADGEGRLILTRGDYRYYEDNRRTLFARLQRDLMSRRFLFVGYSLQDPNFRSILDDCLRELGPQAPPHSFAIMKGFNNTEAAFWRKTYNVSLIEGDAVQTLTELRDTWLSSGLSRVAAPVKKTISERTRKTYERDFNKFARWCNEFDFPSLPTTPEVVMVYLAALSNGNVRVDWRARDGSLKTQATPQKFSSIELAYMAIIHAQRSAGHEWPHAHPGIVGVKKVIRVKFGTAKKKVAPLEIGTLKKCLASYGASTEVAAARNRALLSLGFFAALRRSELVAIRVEDVRFTRRGLLITKTSSGKPVAVPTRGNEAICPVRLLRAWLDQSGITKGPLFRRIDSRTGAIGGVALTPQSIALVIKSAVERAGLDPEPFGGHSLRAGFATSAAAAGKSLHDIMRQTRHRSERIAMTYTRQPARRHAREEYLFEDNPADGID